MTNSKKKNILLTLLPILAALSGATACGQSPLFNHNTAPSPGAGNPTDAKTQADQSACPLTFSKAQLCAALVWTQPPAGEETGAFSLKFWNPAQGTGAGPYAEPGAAVAVKLWMPSMGHGSSPVTLAHAADPDTHQDLPGQFNGTNVFFVMPGTWEIHVQLKNGSTIVEEAVLVIQI